MKALRARPGFTLLEVVVALAILGVSLMAVLDVNAQAVASHIYARKLTVATLLARSKMTDLEQKLYDEGLPVDDDEDAGDFSDEGWPSYKWRARILAPRTQNLTPDQLFGSLFGIPLGAGGDDDPTGGLLAGLFGGGKSSADTGGAADQNPLMAAMGPMAAMAGQQFTAMVQQLQQSVREVHLTVSWKEGKLTESIDVVTHVVSLGPGSDRNGGQAAAQGQPAASGDQLVRADNGQPVLNPVPATNGAGMVDPRDGMAAIPMSQYQSLRGGAGGLPLPAGRTLVPSLGGRLQLPGVGNLAPRGGGFR